MVRIAPAAQPSSVKKGDGMSSLKTLRIAALVSVSMLQLAIVAHAQNNSGSAASTVPATDATLPSLGEITFGGMGVTDSSAAYGRYNGMPNSGAGLIGGWNLHTRDIWDSGGTNYMSFTGDNVNVGLGEIAPEASINLKIGQQGLWGVSASYDAMTYTASNNFTTILNPDGPLSS